MYLYFRYLIDAKWFKQWKKYVGFGAWDAGSVGDETVFPGPIDNTPLCKDERAKHRRYYSRVAACVNACIYS